MTVTGWQPRVAIKAAVQGVQEPFGAEAEFSKKLARGEEKVFNALCK